MLIDYSQSSELLDYSEENFSCFCLEVCVVGAHWGCLLEAILMSTSMYSDVEVRKNVPNNQI